MISKIFLCLAIGLLIFGCIAGPKQQANQNPAQLINTPKLDVLQNQMQNNKENTSASKNASTASQPATRYFSFTSGMLSSLNLRQQDLPSGYIYLSNSTIHSGLTGNASYYEYGNEQWARKINESGWIAADEMNFQTLDEKNNTINTLYADLSLYNDSSTMDCGIHEEILNAKMNSEGPMIMNATAFGAGTSISYVSSLKWLPPASPIQYTISFYWGNVYAHISLSGPNATLGRVQSYASIIDRRLKDRCNGLCQPVPSCLPSSPGYGGAPDTINSGGNFRRFSPSELANLTLQSSEVLPYRFDPDSSNGIIYDASLYSADSYVGAPSQEKLISRGWVANYDVQYDSKNANGAPLIAIDNQLNVYNNASYLSCTLKDFEKNFANLNGIKLNTTTTFGSGNSEEFLSYYSNDPSVNYSNMSQYDLQFSRGNVVANIELRGPPAEVSQAMLEHYGKLEDQKLIAACNNGCETTPPACPASG